MRLFGVSCALWRSLGGLALHAAVCRFWRSLTRSNAQWRCFCGLALYEAFWRLELFMQFGASLGYLAFLALFMRFGIDETTWRFWRSSCCLALNALFGDPSALGRSLMLSGALGRSFC